MVADLDKPTYVPRDFDMELAQFTLRIHKLLFFGTMYLCGLEPPVLKLELVNGYKEYVSVVQTSASRDSPASPPELVSETICCIRHGFYYFFSFHFRMMQMN